MNEAIIFSTILLGIGISGLILNKKHIISMLMSLELMLLAVNTNFITFSSYWNNVTGQVMVLFIFTVAASEAAIGLAILVILFRNNNSINVVDINNLKG